MAEPFLSRDPADDASTSRPRGWAQCNGQLLPINQNQALFSLLGTTFGGDGRVNFALPDLRGRVPIHVGSGHTLGERGGEQAHTLTHRRAPAAHARRCRRRRLDRRHAGRTGEPAGRRTAATLYASPAQPDDARPDEPSRNVGGSQAHLNMQPFLTLNFCIALIGIFPSPN